MKKIIEIRAAEGGEDSKLFSQDLFNAYRRMCDKLGWKSRDLGELSLEVQGSDLKNLTNEAGGHRIQRIPPTERSGRVHTSTVTVAILNEPRKTQTEIPDKDIRIEWYSGTGCGGQYRNKHQNSCRITHIPTGTVRKAETRSRDNSYQSALKSLQEALMFDQEHTNAVKDNLTRQNQIGSGMRGDKRRTYRFREDSVYDQVTGKTAKCSDVMRGKFNLLWW